MERGNIPQYGTREVHYIEYLAKFIFKREFHVMNILKHFIKLLENFIHLIIIIIYLRNNNKLIFT